MLNNERGYVGLDFQPISVIVNNSNQLKTKFNVMFKYKPKKMQDFKTF